MSADSIKVTRSLFQAKEGGAVPTSAHDFTVIECTRKDIKEVIEKNHYSGSINGVCVTHCFAITFNQEIFGGAIFGKCAMMGQAQKYTKNPDDLLELRRFACVDKTPKNTESFFISKCLMLLKKKGYKYILSYADANYGHTGAIYKASNFKYLGETSKGKVIMFNGKKYHDKTIRTNYNGLLKPFAQKIKDALESGDAKYLETRPKYIFLFSL